MSKHIAAVLFLAPFLSGCSTMNIDKIVEQLKQDPATFDIEVHSVQGSLTIHRSFPTNWLPQAPLVK